jgi:hypothetical protein
MGTSFWGPLGKLAKQAKDHPGLKKQPGMSGDIPIMDDPRRGGIGGHMGNTDLGGGSIWSRLRDMRNVGAIRGAATQAVKKTPQPRGVSANAQPPTRFQGVPGGGIMGGHAGNVMQSAGQGRTVESGKASRRRAISTYRRGVSGR